MWREKKLIFTTFQTVQSSDLMDDTSRAYLQNVIQKTTGFVQEFNKQLLSRVSFTCNINIYSIKRF